MAGIQTQPAQGAVMPKPAQPKDQTASQAEAQPVFRDWAAI